MSESSAETRAYCPECGLELEEDAEWCPEDGTRLYSYQVSDDEDEEDELVGKRLDDRFEVEHLLGEGGMGKVYAGCQLSVDRDVAIKVLQPDLIEDDEAIKRFFREARVISGLNHPNVVQLYDFGQEEETGEVYYVMEMVGGSELSDLLRKPAKSRLAAPLALEIAHQACRGLAEPHQEGIIHRDLKPENLMIVPMADGRIQVKVLDFGLARALQTETNLTQTGMVCGTAHYMSPQQAEGKELGPKTDIYALGCVLFEMLTGHHMFGGDSATQIMLKHVQHEPPDLDRLPIADELPDDLPELIRSMVHKEPEPRPESVREIQERIDDMRDAERYGRISIESGLPLGESLEEWILDATSLEPVDDEPPSPAPASDEATAPASGSQEDDIDPLANTAAVASPSSGEPEVAGVPESEAANDPAAAHSPETADVPASQPARDGSGEQADAAATTEPRSNEEVETAPTGDSTTAKLAALAVVLLVLSAGIAFVILIGFSDSTDKTTTASAATSPDQSASSEPKAAPKESSPESENSAPAETDEKGTSSSDNAATDQTDRESGTTDEETDSEGEEAPSPSASPSESPKTASSKTETAPREESKPELAPDDESKSGEDPTEETSRDPSPAEESEPEPQPTATAEKNTTSQSDSDDPSGTNSSSPSSQDESPSSETTASASSSEGATSDQSGGDDKSDGGDEKKDKKGLNVFAID